MKKVRLFSATVILVIAISSAFLLLPPSVAHAAPSNSSVASTCISSAMPTTNLMGSKTYLQYQSLDYSHTAYFQATQTGYVGGGTFTVRWWIYKGTTLIDSQVIDGWNAAFSPIYYPISGLEVGGKIVYGTSPTEFLPAAYNCDGYWWPGTLVTA